MQLNPSGIRRELPNWLSSLRLLLCTPLLVLDLCGSAFLCCYGLAGLSDMLDGLLARRWQVCSRAGEQLDTVADFGLFVTLLFRLMPLLLTRLPAWIGWWILGIFLARVLGWLCAGLCRHCFVAVHTFLNRLSGLALFCLPWMLVSPVLLPYAVLLCLLCSVATVEEWYRLAVANSEA